MKLSSALLLPAAAVAFVGQAPAQKANVARSAVLERPAAAASPVLGFHVDGHAVVLVPLLLVELRGLLDGHVRVVVRGVRRVRLEPASTA